MDELDFGMPHAVLDEIIFRSFGDKIGLFAIIAPPSLLAMLLRGGAVKALDASFARLTGPQHEQHRVLIARRLEQVPSAAICEANFSFLCRLAVSVAFEAQAPARSLQQKLLLKPEARSYRPLLEELRQALHQSSLLQSLSKDSRRFWLLRMRHSESACNWRGIVAVQALREVVLKGHHWSGGAMLQKFTPEGVWRRAWGERWWLVLGERARRLVRHPVFRFSLVIAFVFGWLAVAHHVQKRREQERREVIRHELGDEFFYDVLAKELGRRPTVEEISQFGDELDAIREKQVKKLPEIAPLRE